MPSIVGTWKLAGATARDAAGVMLPSPYGGKGIGRVTFTVDGRMMSVVEVKVTRPIPFPP